jgi:enoyl-[acyl-carrier protein] reductase II
MSIQTPICTTLGVDHPIVLGGMMGISDAKLTAAVSNAGGLGTLSSATFGLDGSREQMELLSELTDKPYSVNLPLFHPMIPELITLLPEFGVKIVTSSAGNPTKYTQRLKDLGIYVIHVVSSVRTALKAQEAGVDAIVAEGSESGGKVARDEVPTISLVPQVIENVDIPVIAAGGLATGRGLLAALAMGAQAVQMGTRFIASTETTRAHENWKQVLVNAGDSATAIACKNSSPTRMVKNDFFAEVNALDEPGKTAMDFMPIMGEGSSRIPGDLDGSQGNYTAGTGSGLIREVLPTAQIMRDIIEEAEQGMAQMRKAFAA